MTSFMKFVGSVAAIVLLAGVVSADEQVFAGKIKSVDAVKKHFVATDADGKDHTFKIGDAMTVCRDGKESASDLRADEAVNICYDKGTLTWTAQFILVQDDASKNCYLVECTIKNYDADTKELVYTDAVGKDCTIPMGASKIRLNGNHAKIADVKTGDKVLAVVEKVGTKTALKDLMIQRSK